MFRWLSGFPVAALLAASIVANGGMDDVTDNADGA